METIRAARFISADGLEKTILESTFLSQHGGRIEETPEVLLPLRDLNRLSFSSLEGSDWIARHRKYAASGYTVEPLTAKDVEYALHLRIYREVVESHSDKEKELNNRGKQLSDRYKQLIASLRERERTGVVDEMMRIIADVEKKFGEKKGEKEV